MPQKAPPGRMNPLLNGAMANCCRKEMQLGKHQPELLDMSLQENRPTTDAQSIADLQGQKLALLREKCFGD